MTEVTEVPTAKTIETGNTVLDATSVAVIGVIVASIHIYAPNGARTEV
jgi:hypothetical protein